MAAELIGSFHRKVDAGAPLCPGAAALPAAPERHRVRARRRVCRVLVVPSLLPVDSARGRTFARSLEEVDLGVLSDCLRRPEASGS
ncbi:hypothetical protein [Streptomyces sp. ms115]|uniref:hypothetical protein n=1 Tax=Streptomyces sp. ms115 TaxID=1827928 RepID=UPI00211D3B21|nr:hypothetical protein [Streptomyces sp. ms115]